MTAETYMAVKAVPEGTTNMALGEPIFLQQALAPLYPTATALVLENELRYQPPCGVDALIAALPRLGQGDHFVVANGAKQALAAAMYALHKVHGAKTAQAVAPHWPSFPTLARQAGLVWETDLDAEVDVDIITQPNNPTGRVNLPIWRRRGRVIWDAAYASPVYGHHVVDGVVADVTVGSAAKLYGLSGLRLGWLQTPSAALADAAGEFVEATTSGVSTAAQAYFLDFMHRIREQAEEFVERYSLAAETLQNHGNAFLWALEPHLDSVLGVPAGAGGMFAFVKPRDRERFEAALAGTRILTVPGAVFGCPLFFEGWHRFSLGLGSRELLAALKALKQELR